MFVEGFSFHWYVLGLSLGACLTALGVCFWFWARKRSVACVGAACFVVGLGLTLYYPNAWNLAAETEYYLRVHSGGDPHRAVLYGPYSDDEIERLTKIVASQ